ncbi:MAG: KUP/HAK/KT family potassium transporter [Bdellovibrio bacteriovorus]
MDAVSANQPPAPHDWAPCPRPALGIAFGDIGTSPLHAIQAVFANAPHPVPVEPLDVLGLLSLVPWSLVVLVSFKYPPLHLRADSRGEGGILALIALVQGSWSLGCG